MRKLQSGGAVLAALLFALSLTACSGQKTVQTEQTTQTAPSTTQSTAPSEQTTTENQTTDATPQTADASLKEADARALATEKLPKGYTASSAGTISTERSGETHSFYLFKIKNADKQSVGTIAIDKESGERYNYAGKGVVNSYSNFKLYNAASDAAYSWDGDYMRDKKLSVTLAQEDDQTVDFTFTDGMDGIGRISGSKATTSDGRLTLTFQSQKLLKIQDKKNVYTGSYRLTSSD